MIAYVVAFLWGIAEATLFFIVPDVWLSLVALRGARRAVAASLVTALGAVIGGGIMLAWATLEPQQALAAVEQVPAISQAMVADVYVRLQQQGLIAVLLGAFRGVPYKIFSVQIPRTTISPTAFLLFSVPARLARFVLVSIVVAGLDSLWFRTWSVARKQRLLLAGWVLFYLLYLLRTPW